MADKPVDTNGSPFIAAVCRGCGTNVVAVPEADPQDTLCLECRRAQTGIDWPAQDPLGDWHPTVGYAVPGSGGAVTERAVPFPAAPEHPSRYLHCVYCGDEWLTDTTFATSHAAEFDAHERGCRVLTAQRVR